MNYEPLMMICGGTPHEKNYDPLSRQRGGSPVCFESTPEGSVHQIRRQQQQNIFTTSYNVACSYRSDPRL